MNKSIISAVHRCPKNWSFDRLFFCRHSSQKRVFRELESNRTKKNNKHLIILKMRSIFKVIFLVIIAVDIKAHCIRRAFKTIKKSFKGVSKLKQDINNIFLISNTDNATNSWFDFNDMITLNQSNDTLMTTVSEISASISTRNFTKEIFTGVYEGFLAEIVSVLLYESSESYTVSETAHTTLKSVLLDMLTNFVTVAYPKLQKETEVSISL